MNAIDNAVKNSLSGRLPVIIFIMSVLLGLMALKQTPREEEPQIVVPMLDIYVAAPNVEAPEVARLVTEPLEKLLAQLTGVEHIYSTTQSNAAVVTLRFEVGHDREQAILDTYAKLYSYQHTMASVISSWQIRPVEVNDVPIVMLGLFSKDPKLYDDYQLTRFANEIANSLQRIENTSEVKVIAGRTRQLTINLDASALAAHQTTLTDVYYALSVSNQLVNVGSVVEGKQQIALQVGDVLRSQSAIERLVVNVVNGKSVYLSDVAQVSDGPSEAQSYQWLAHSDNQQLPLVTISVAKQAGTNAVAVANEVHSMMDSLSANLLPDEVGYTVLRDYGQTANEKVNNLTSSLVFAVFTVVIFVGVFLGWRPAIVVGLAVPICYGITLTLDFAFGYTINRVTLFALILSLGLLVDDPITGIDNISRFLTKKGDKKQRIVDAMSEIRVALFMSTLTIMVAFIPLAFITGMMGPYMAPMAFNVPVSVMVSTIVAFFVTPWLAMKLLKAPVDDSMQLEANPHSLYERILSPLLESKGRAKLVLWTTLALFVASAMLPVMRAVPLKLLPFDNKNELQVLIDMPEGTSLEQTAAFTRQVQTITWQLNEVSEAAAYVGQPSSMDFNGMVRGYYRREAANLAELRVLLLDKTERDHQSHGVVMRLRAALAPLATDGIVIKVVEVPPGPPVLSTLVAEVYSEPFVDTDTHYQAALAVAARLKQEPHVVEVDTSIAANAPLQRFVTDKSKASLSAVSTQDIAQTLAIASHGQNVGVLYVSGETDPVDIKLQLPYQDRNQFAQLLALQVRGDRELAKTSDEFGLQSAPRPLVALSELGEFQHQDVAKPIMRKDQRNVVYVMAELNGRTPAEIIADVNADLGISADEFNQTDWQSRHFFNNGGSQAWQLPAGTDVTFSGEGEWRITIDVFRDMGIAFAFALTAIFIILRIQTNSASLSLIIMSAIPLTVIGIMPGFWLLNQFGERSIAGAPEPVLFTATAMIGMIALAGIVVRNSLILVEFINQARGQGMAIKQALIAAGTVRMRPVLLTAGTTLLGNLVITLDPVFSGLAIAIIFGIVASTLFSLFVVPLVYYLVFAKDAAKEEQAHAG
ncbi:acriflavine resistance protein B [Pseudoalteromonas sp. XI10]|uniref:efflux RND transporter permease subunit n=1 Tax=Pseudoalteromonas sp. XI10 TaxID=1766621 RepID=UPI000733762C|nr:efflux RND transporter permease subunit [Pseudoalteromonas sp. XI10]KTG19072.1 acriflavine resistance protein B [Pseudoalteromonas sp. XI10]